MADLSDLTLRPMDLQDQAMLRSRAAARLTGAAAAKGTPASAVDALTVLHALASSPATAADALALLHELQVHQVELELQAQELHDSRADLETALRRHIERHDAQPVGCLGVDAQLLVHELNRSGAGMLGLAQDAARGQPLDRFFGSEGARRLRAALASLDAGQAWASCLLELSPVGGAVQPVLVNLGKDSEAGRYLLTLARGVSAPD